MYLKAKVAHFYNLYEDISNQTAKEIRERCGEASLKKPMPYHFMESCKSLDYSYFMLSSKRSIFSFYFIVNNFYIVSFICFTYM